MGSGTQTSLNQLVEARKEIIDADPKVEYTESLPGDIRHSLAGIEKAQRLMGFAPKIPFKEGLRRTATWFKATG